MKYLKTSLVLLCPLIWLSVSAQESPSAVKFSAPKLGSLVSITIYREENVDTVTLERQCWFLIDSLNQVFSDYLEDSEINHLTAFAGKDTAIEVSQVLMDLMQKSVRMSRETDGTFDVSIGALTKLWRKHLAEGSVPARKQIRQARKTVNYASIGVNPENSTISIPHKGTSLDFGGIAKGYIGDCVAAMLESQEVTRYLIDMGGDLILGDPPPGKEFWHIKSPWLGQVLELRNMAVATSGPDYQFFVHKGEKYAHILDPKTGWGVSRPFSVSVIAPSGWEADALASACAILPADVSLQLMESKENVEYALGLGDEYLESMGFQRFVEKISKKN